MEDFEELNYPIAVCVPEIVTILGVKLLKGLVVSILNLRRRCYAVE